MFVGGLRVRVTQQKTPRDAERLVLYCAAWLSGLRRGNGDTTGEATLATGSRVLVDDSLGGGAINHAEGKIGLAGEGLFGFGFNARFRGLVAQLTFGTLAQTLLG